MKQLLDFIPLIVFFALYKYADIYIATGALIAATALQIAVTYMVYKKCEKMQLITFALVTIFGGMTIAFHNPDFIKWKVSLINWIFAIGLMVSHLMGKSLIKSMLGKELTLPDAIWTRVTWAWVGFFTLSGIVNIFLAYHVSLDVWVNFKVFGLFIATLVFTVLTVLYMYKHMPKKDSDA